MGIRTWTTTALQEGDTLTWFTGLFVKASAELTAAAALGWVTTEFVLWKLPVSAIRSYLGTGAADAVWFAISAALFVEFTLCKFTEQLTDE